MDFAEFYRDTCSRTLRYAYGLTGDLPQAQDVTQEAYVRAWQRWAEVSGYDNSEAWLRLVINRQVIDWWKHLRVRRNARYERPADLPGPSEDTVLVTTALRQLPAPQRKALALHYLLDLPVAQIAAETGVSEGTVKSWLSRGRAGLAEKLREEASTAKLRTADQVAGVARRRRRTRMIAAVTAASLALILVVGLVVVMMRRARDEQPVQRPVTPWHSMSEISTDLPVATQRSFRTAIGNGRGYAAWMTESEGRFTVGAVDLATGATIWSAQPTGGVDGNLLTLTALPNVLVVTSESTRGLLVGVLDAGNGAFRWQRMLARPKSVLDPLGQELLYYEEAAVIVDRRAGTVIGLDWRRGREMWGLTGQAAAVGIVHASDVKGPSSLYGRGPRPEFTGRTLLTIDSSGTATERKALDGKAANTRRTGVPVGVAYRYSAYEGKLYAFDDEELVTVDLGGAGPTATYEAVGPHLYAARPCGGDAVCILDGDGSGGGVLYVKGHIVKVRGSTVVAKAEVERASDIEAAGDGLLATGEYGVLYGPALRPYMSDAEFRTVLRLDRRTVLVLTHNEFSQTSDVRVVDPVSGRGTDLGRVTMYFGTVTDGERLLGVDRDGGLRIYRFQ